MRLNSLTPTIKIYVINMIFLFCNIFSFNAEFIESKGILLTWESKEPLKEVQILYSPFGKNYYSVMIKKYPFSTFETKDTFFWIFNPLEKEVFNKIKEKGKIKVIYFKEGNKKFEEVIYLSDLKIRAHLFSEKEEKESFLSTNLSSFDYGTYPPWPMFQVNPQHTGEYPYSVYPPLTHQWTYTLDYNDFVMLSASISSNGVIYISDGGRFLKAIDVATGNILWKKGLTANVWTTALVNDTLVLAGTSISFDTTKPTLFLLDARTGNIIWGRHFPGLYTVEFQPIVVESLIYVTTLNKTKLFAITINGNLIWEFIVNPQHYPPGDGVGYENKKVFAGADKMYAFDWHTGEIKWIFDPQSGYWGIGTSFPLSWKDKIYFIAESTLYALKEETGEVMWEKEIFNKGNFPTPSYYNNLIFYSDKNIIMGLNSSNGVEKWKIFFPDSYVTSIIITPNDVLWMQSDQKIFVIDINNKNIIYEKFSLAPYDPPHYAWFWPIFYGNYVCVAHFKKMNVYKGIKYDDIKEDALLVLPIIIRDHAYIFFEISEDKRVFFQIFDINGRLKEKIDLGYLRRGKHFYFWKPNKLSQGIYFLYFNKTKKQKIMYLKGGG
jgi:outer membrane protein assembly factor BamB